MAKALRNRGSAAARSPRSLSSNPRLLHLMATPGCSGPRAFSPMAKALRYRGSAAARSPRSCSSNPRLLQSIATSGCSSPKAFSSMAKALRNRGSAAARSPRSLSSSPRLVHLMATLGCSGPSSMAKALRSRGSAAARWPRCCSSLPRLLHSRASSPPVPSRASTVSLAYCMSARNVAVTSCSLVFKKVPSASRISSSTHFLSSSLEAWPFSTSTLQRLVMMLSSSVRNASMNFFFSSSGKTMKTSCPAVTWRPISKQHQIRVSVMPPCQGLITTARVFGRTIVALVSSFLDVHVISFWFRLVKSSQKRMAAEPFRFTKSLAPSSVSETASPCQCERKTSARPLIPQACRRLCSK